MRTEELNLIAQSKCLEYGVYIYTVPTSTKSLPKVEVVINNAGKIIKSKDSKEYCQKRDKKKIQDKIWELYRHIYTKNKDKWIDHL